jgi:flavin reductase (DIM6/NTAB) family NADH-FMN oxidoreductase RutF
MHFDPRNETCPLPYDPFQSCTVPRPIGWLSTVSTTGIANLAPFSQWQNLTFDPPMVMFAANRNADGRPKDTVVNAEATGWFVWNMATWALREAVNISAADFPPDVDEFEKAGVSKAPSIEAPAPRVAESPCHFECRYLSTMRLPGRSPMGTVDVVFGEVVRIHVADDVVLPSGKLDIGRIAPIARMGYYDYAVIRDVFEMRIPTLSAALMQGLEGRRRT